MCTQVALALLVRHVINTKSRRSDYVFHMLSHSNVILCFMPIQI